MTFPLFLTSIFPADFLNHTEGILVYLSLHLLSSIYESCGPAFAYLLNRTVFETQKIRIAHLGDYSENTIDDGEAITARQTSLGSNSIRAIPPGRSNNRKEPKVKGEKIVVLPSGLDSVLKVEKKSHPFSRLKSKQLLFKNRNTVKPFSNDLKTESKENSAQILKQGRHQDVVTSRYCGKHFVAHKDTPQVKRAQTKIFVLKKGKIQEETEENIGWMYYGKQQNKIYMKELGPYECPKCKPRPPLAIKEKKKCANSKLFTSGKPRQVTKRKQTKELLQLDINVFYERPSDSELFTSPSIDLIYKDFETS